MITDQYHVHAEFNKLNQFINKKNPDLIFQCGDFGYWPKFDGKYELGNHKRNICKKKWSGEGQYL